VIEDYTEIAHRWIQDRLGDVRRKRNVVALLQGAAVAGGGTLAIVILMVVLESIVRLDVLFRTIGFWALVAFAAGLVSWFAGRPLLRLLGVLSDVDDEKAAQLVGDAFPAVKDRLVNVLQLFPERDRAVPYYSRDLIDAAVEDLRRDAEPLDFSAAVSGTRALRMAQRVGWVAAGAAVLCVLFPGTFVESARRLFLYNQVFAAPAPFTFVVEPGNATVTKGDAVTITVHVLGQTPKDLVIASKPEPQVAFEEHSFHPSPSQIFTYEFPSIRTSTVYYIRADDVRSEIFTLTVTDRPMVRMLRIKLDFPKYTGLVTRQLEDNVGDITALRGAHAHLTIETNKPLHEAVLLMADSTTLELRANDTQATGTLVVSREGAYQIRLRDHDGRTNADPITYNIHIVPDAYPSVSILVPGINIDVSDDASLGMLVKIADDFGISRLRLMHRLTHSRYEKPTEEFTSADIPLPAGSRTEMMVPYSWDLRSLSLTPEDVVQYRVEVFDNDNISGPKSAVSESYTLRVPSMDEVFSEADKGHDVSKQTMEQALQQSRDAKKELESLIQDMKKEQPKKEWQQQKRAEELLKKYGEIQKKMEDVNRTIEQITTSLQKNQLLSPQTLEKYAELQQLMSQLNSPELAEALRKLQEAMQRANPDALKEALQNLEFSEEAFRKSVERTLNLLKRIQIEQKVDEMVRRSEAMMKQQEEVQGQTRQADAREQRENLMQKQADLRRQLDSLREAMEDVERKMQEFPKEMPLAELKKAQEELDQSGLESDLEQAVQQMEQQDMEAASQQQQSAINKMQQFHKQLQKTSQAMQQRQQEQVVREMRKALQDMLELSKRQEKLKNEARALDQNSQQLRENAQQQADIRRDLAGVTDRLGSLAQKTFSITPEMGKAIGDAMRSMDQAVEMLGNRNGAVAADHQGAAMASLNDAAAQLQSGLNAMMQGGGQGGGMASLMQRLQQMAGKQQSINEATRNMLTQRQLAEMSRLAGEQGAVRKSLEELAREAARSGETSRILGDLNRIAEEMREVQTDLAQQDVNPETIRRQDRILSRLLDSQKSMRERDYEQRRKAESGSSVARRSPGELDLTSQEGRDSLRRDLLKALEEGYARDYEMLIRKYFEALER